jgi:YfiH family protein
VRAFTTSRAGGCSEGAWGSLNLGLRCGDDERCVRENRARLSALLPAAPQWLRQVHGVEVAEHPGAAVEEATPEADALVAFAPGRVCAVLTADCLPVVFCDRAGSRVGVAHAGWRGLAGGVLEHTVQAMDCAPAELLAWLGPAIGPCVYEVGPEVVEAFDGIEGAAAPGRRPDRWLLDLYGIARHKLRAAGVGEVHGGGLCTFSDPARFYSYRRDGTTGRMATLIWME